MTAVRRWPVHPAPTPGEALSSWLRRIAVRYEVHIEDLVVDLGFWPGKAADLDTCPPERFAQELSTRTGVDAQRIRRMSLSGWSPWLLDRAEPDPGTFAKYTRQFSVLLPAEIRWPREIYPWMPWCPTRPAVRACPHCIATTAPPHPYELLWLLPLTLSCPIHGCLLEMWTKSASYFGGWERRPPTPRPVPATLLAMDTRTWQAMATGRAQLLSQQVAAGTWFRLMRTIIDELGAPLTECRTANRMIMWIWKHAGHSGRVGPLKWQPHEGYSIDSQLRTLEATATAIQLLESDALIGRGADTVFFRPATATDSGWP